MFRKIFFLLVMGFFIFGMSKLSFAMMCGDHSGSQQLAQAHSEHEHGTTEVVKEARFSEQAVNVNNKICPVSGEKIQEKTKSAYEYEGKIYNLCCASCIEEFKKDPQKYIKKVEEELQSASRGQPAHEGHEMGSM
ncbi:MAG: YHS domain-containing protein [Candidatus Omnitrophota bacterium]|nr:YHS domain-containing protein [Candidatus Omnitrophota bacterium]